MTNRWVKSNKWQLGASLVLPLMIVLTRPMALTQSQALVFGAVVLAIIWWASELVDKTLASVLLLTAYLLGTKVPVETVFYFPLSDSFLLVASSFLLSKGIINTGVARRVASTLIVRRCRNTRELLTMTFVIGFALTFLIPHPFSRIILLSGIYLEMLDEQGIKGAQRTVILFAVTVTNIASSMLLINGDVILNYSAIRFAEIGVTGSEWLKIMTLPAALSYLLIWMVFRVLFFRPLTSKLSQTKEVENPLNGKQKLSLAIMLAVILLWFTEGLHHINSAYPALVGVAVMLFAGIIKPADHKAINYRLMIFMTAIFATGKVLVGEGIAEAMSATLLSVFPSAGSPWYLIALIGGIALIHLMIGSSLATMSVIMLPLVSLTSGALNPVVVAMMTLMIVNTHFILPIHHTVLLVGYGERHFDSRVVAKYGAAMTVLLLPILYGLFFPWWRLIGLLQ